MYLSGNIFYYEMNDNQLKAICDPTRLMILDLLSQGALTNTELYNKMKEIAYRESIFKSLKKLLDAGLIKREHHEKVGYKYSLKSKTLKIGKNSSLIFNTQI